MTLLQHIVQHLKIRNSHKTNSTILRESHSSWPYLALGVNEIFSQLFTKHSENFSLMSGKFWRPAKYDNISRFHCLLVYNVYLTEHKCSLRWIITYFYTCTHVAHTHIIIIWNEITRVSPGCTLHEKFQVLC